MIHGVERISGYSVKFCKWQSIHHNCRGRFKFWKKKIAMCAVPRKWTIVEARSPVKEAIVALWAMNDEFLKGIGHGDGAKLAE